ncbi:protein TSSC4 [Myripristis murdjan]|uniref:protein TSSC4 n=1 Tax=Myripristis murdjan TaxID=586833 RepID=UPI001175D565|nr:protein TSSC4 [Myripristis murdjan]XP_029933224.1 protein TSSC4 [Myripristis murdjan]
MCDQENGLSHRTPARADDVTLPDELSASDDSEPEEEPSGASRDPQLRDLHSFIDDDDDDDDDDDGDEGEVQLGAAPRSQSSFSLKGGSSGFSSRSLSIFGSLDSVARPAAGEDTAAGETFARPSRPPPRAVPDYLLHPERWTHYSLEDVAESSERENRAAARHFLQQRRQQQERPQHISSSQDKVIFSRPSGRPGRERAADELKAAGGREMSLSHLEEDEEEEGGSLWTRRSSKVKEKSTEREERGEEDEEKEEVRAPVKPPPQAEERKRKWEEQGGAAEEEEEERQQVNPGFTSFRKSNRKNYRRSSEQDDS